MATALAPEKPPLGQKMPQAWSRLENRPLSRRMHREKCRPLVRLASGAPVFANGAVTAAMAYAFNQAQNSPSSERRIDRRIGAGENFVEISDDNALMIFEELGLNRQTVSQLSRMQPLDQITIDLAIEGLAAAVIGDTVLTELVESVVETASMPLRARSVRQVLTHSTTDPRFDPARLQNAIDSRLDGIGQGARTAAAARIGTRVNCQAQGC